RVLGQEQDPPPEHHLIRQLLDATGAQRSEHRAKHYPLPRPEQGDSLGGRDPPPPHPAKHPERRPDGRAAQSAREGELRNRREPPTARRRASRMTAGRPTWRRSTSPNATARSTS